MLTTTKDKIYLRAIVVPILLKYARKELPQLKSSELERVEYGVVQTLRQDLC